MKQIISGHNSKLLSSKQTDTQTDQQTKKECNCQRSVNCPLDNKCLIDSVIYQATVSQPSKEKEDIYIGLSADKFKLRWANHKKSFKNETYQYETTLSQHIWDLKRSDIPYNIQWKIIDRGKQFSPVSNICQLCTKEKYHIIFTPENSLLNNRNELGTFCRHKNRLLLKNS